DVDRVQPLDIAMVAASGWLLGPHQHVKSSSYGIDHRRRRNPDLRLDERTAGVAARYRGDVEGRVDEADCPERRQARARGVERVYRAMLGGNEQHVVRSTIGDLQMRHVKRLRVNVAVHLKRD